MNLATSNLLRTFAFTLATAAAAHAEVSATQNGGKLKLTSDADADFVRIEGAGALGEVVVIVNSMTVESFEGVRDVAFDGGDGSDHLTISSLQIGGSLSAKFGKGDDSFEMNTVGWGPSLSIFIGGSVDVRLGGGLSDVVAIRPTGGLSVVVAKNLTIRGAADVDIDGGGSSSDSEHGDCFVGGNLRIKRESSVNDSASKEHWRLDDLNVGGTTKIELGAAADTVTITHSHFAGKFSAALGGNTDTLDFAGEDSAFNVTATFDGGAGQDALGNPDQVEFAVPLVQKNVEAIL